MNSVKEIPAIPKDVAEWIDGPLKTETSDRENSKEDMIHIITRFANGAPMNTDMNDQNEKYKYGANDYTKVLNYVFENPLEIITAIINGYTIKKKYYIVGVEHSTDNWSYIHVGKDIFKTTKRRKAEAIANVFKGKVIDYKKD